MLRDGPIPAFIHGLVEYVAGALFVALPLLLGYDSGAATAASIIIGVVMIAVAASTDWGLSLVKNIPKPAHLVIDYLLAVVLIASPFLFGFSSETTPTAIFLATGVLHIVMTIGTRFVKPKPDSDATPPAESGETDYERRFARGERANRAMTPAEQQRDAITGDRSTKPREP